MSVPSPTAAPRRTTQARDDPAAFAALYAQHQQELYRYCSSLLRDRDDAHDALQSTMAKAYAALRDEERDFELRPWLFRIAHNESITLLRARRRQTTSLEQLPELAGEALEDDVDRRRRLTELREDLAALPIRQRSALVLRELSGLSHDEIGTALDATPRAIKQLIFEARCALHDIRDGRDMACAPVLRALSDGDGRVLRGRRMRAHVRTCGRCRGFEAALASRPRELAALAPALPLAGGAALVAQGLGAGAGAGAVASGGAGAGAVAASSGGLATLAGGKGIALLAVAATAAGGAAVVPHHHHQQQRDAARTAKPVVAAERARPRPAARVVPAAAVTPRAVTATTRTPAAAQAASRPRRATPAPATHAPSRAQHATPPKAAGHDKAAQSPKAPKAAGHVKPAKAPKPAHVPPGHAKAGKAGKAKVPPGQAKKAPAPADTRGASGKAKHN